MFVYLDTHLGLEEFATSISLQKSASKETIQHIQPTKSNVMEDTFLYLLSDLSSVLVLENAKEVTQVTLIQNPAMLPSILVKKQ